MGQRRLWIAALLVSLGPGFAFAAGKAPMAAAQIPPGLGRASGTDGEIARLQEALRKGPQTVQRLVALAAACLQKSRETGDPSWLGRAGEALQRAGALDPKDTDLLITSASLGLSRHDFAGALALADRVLGTEPINPSARLVRVDALVELGRYDEGRAALQAILDQKPSPWAFARTAFFRELYGDVDGAVDIMRVAANGRSGDRYAENEAWARSQLAGLLILQGRIDEAELEYRHSLALFPGYVHGLAGLGRVAALRGRLEEAAGLYAQAVRAVPIGEYVIALGEVLTLAGREAEARRQFELVGAMAQLYRASGVDMDLEMAQFDADHGTHLEKTVTDARAAYARRPSVKSADVLGWLLYRSGRPAEALPLARAAVRLGTKDPVILFHTGMAEASVGDKSAARIALSAALAHGPAFLGIHAAAASRTLAEVGGSPALVDERP